jgi:hypothetical protein
VTDKSKRILKFQEIRDQADAKLIDMELHQRAKLAITKLKPLCRDEPHAKLIFTLIEIAIKDAAMPLFTLTKDHAIRVIPNNVQVARDALIYLHSSEFADHADLCGLDVKHIQRILKRLKIML